MENMLPIKLGTVVLDCDDINTLSQFYIRMLGWEKMFECETWISIRHPAGGTQLGIQYDADYTPPVWPESPPAQQQMLHLDFLTADIDEMERAVEHAISCGAKKAEIQYDDKWTVMIDPAGHPFCFVVW